jgi:hypothetical protein
VNDPVWIQTMTGAAVGRGFRTQRLSLRQSSDPCGAPAAFSDAQFAGGAVTLRMLGVHGAAGCGGFQRFWFAVVAETGFRGTRTLFPRQFPGPTRSTSGQDKQCLAHTSADVRPNQYR